MQWTSVDIRRRFSVPGKLNRHGFSEAREVVLGAPSHQCDCVGLSDFFGIGVVVAGVGHENEFSLIRKRPDLEVSGGVSLSYDSAEHPELTGTRAAGFLLQTANATCHLLANPEKELFASIW